MQDYGQPGGDMPPPPKKKKGGKLLLILGIILLIIGLILMVVLWPMVGYIDDEELAKKVAKQESGTFLVKWTLSQDDYDAMEAAEKAGLGKVPDGIDGPGDYVSTIELDKGIPKDEITYQKVPTGGGILGLILLIVGIILLIIGLIKMAKAKKA